MKGSGLGIAPVIPVGMRAVSVRVNDVVGVAGFVLPGMRVDVLVTGNPPGKPERLTNTVLQNILVLSAGQTIQADARGQAINAPTVTLLVTPAEAETVTLAQREGEIQLVLRNGTDHGVETTKGKYVSELFGSLRPAQQVEKAPVPRAVPRAVAWTPPQQAAVVPVAPPEVVVFRGIVRSLEKVAEAYRKDGARQGGRMNAKRRYSWCIVVFLATQGLVWADQGEELRLPVGKSLVIDYPDDIARVSTSNPEVIDAVAVTTRELLVHAKGHGSATLVVWSRAGHRGFYSITVEHDLGPIRKLLRETFPGEDIHIQSARDTVSLTGKVSSQLVADRAAALVAPLAKAVINNLQTTPTGVEQQILLRVRFAEINRNASQSFGVNLLSTGGTNTVGTVSTGQFSAPRASELKGTIPGGLAGTSSTFTISDMLNVFAFRPDLNLGALIKALQSQGVLQILAEPNLVTTNGKEASFLVGGEFPVPVLQGGANAGSVSVQFREFGIRLTFTPTLTDNKTIRMHVRPEVSTIDMANAVTLSGFTIPALSTRRIETNVELAEGQSSSSVVSSTTA